MTALSPARQRLSEEGLSILPRLVHRMARRYPSVDREELRSAGAEALVVAASRYEYVRGPFEGFAFKHAERAMLEVVRKTLGLRTREHGAFERLEPGEFEEPDLDAALLATPDGDRAATQRDPRLRVAAVTSALLVESANDGEDAFLQHRAMTIGRAVVAQTGDALGEPDRTFFVRFLQDDRTLAEIAAELGVPRMTARRVGDRVKERLADALRDAKVA